jgi:DNA-binding phage protein
MPDTVTTYRADLLQKAKEKSGKNNSEIARETGFSRPTVISVFKGDSDSVDAIQAVAKTLGLTLSQLFSRAA